MSYRIWGIVISVAFCLTFWWGVYLLVNWLMKRG
jgi:hypothetical protein